MGAVKRTHHQSVEWQVAKKIRERDLDRLAGKLGSKKLVKQIIAIRELMVAEAIYYAIIGEADHGKVKQGTSDQTQVHGLHLPARS